MGNRLRAVPHGLEGWSVHHAPDSPQTTPIQRSFSSTFSPLSDTACRPDTAKTSSALNSCPTDKDVPVWTDARLRDKGTVFP